MPCALKQSVDLEFDVYLFAVEDLIDSLVSPCKELLVEVEEVDREECSRCQQADLEQSPEQPADKATLLSSE